MTRHRTRPSSHKPRPSGFALVIVLWTLGVLALLGTVVTSNARVQMRQAGDMRDRAAAEAAADAGIRQAMFVLLGGGRVGSPGVPIRIAVGDAVVSIMSEDQSAKINPNTVSRELLRSLLIAVDVDPPRAARLAGEIADWRLRGQMSALGGPKIDQYRERQLPYRSGDHAFYSVDELGLVADMTPDILDRLRPWLSVYQEGDVNDPTGTTPTAVAISDTSIARRGPAGPGFVSRNVIMRLTATAVVHGRARFVRSAVVRIRAVTERPASSAVDLVQVLTWE